MTPPPGIVDDPPPSIASPLPPDRDDSEARLEAIASALCRLAALDFDHPLECRGDETVLDSVAGSINMLAEELRATLADRAQIALELEERVRARTADLAASVDRYRMLVESTNVVPWELDASLNVSYVAPHVAVLFGESPSTFIGNASIWDFTHPDDREQVRSDMAALAARRDGHGSLEYRIVRRDGSIVDVRTIASARHVREDDLSSLRGVTFDVTEQRKLESDLRRTHKFEAVGRLAAGIAHEINTPVQFVGDNLSFLRESFDALLELHARTRALLSGTQADECRRLEEEADLTYRSEEVPKAIGQSLDGLTQVAELVNALNTFAHQERGGQAPLDLHATLQAVVALARSEMKDVADVVLELGEIPSVMAFASGLKQVFLNLLVNAAQSVGEVVGKTGDRGKIWVRTERDGKDVVVAIADTGAGIPEDIRDRVFDLFFTTKAVGEGSGQGLALARATVVDKHGGTLTFESVVGRGTTFFVRLPIAGRT